MVKFVNKHKPPTKKTTVKSIKSKTKKKVPAPRKIWKASKSEDVKLPLNVEEVTRSVSALLQVIKKEKGQGKKSLFKDDSQAIMLQVSPVKIPETSKLHLRIILPHSLAVEKADVCLITPDVDAATREDHEPTINFYQHLLQKHNIKNKIQIVPIRQLRSENVTYESKGRFAKLYDIYLVDGRLLGKVIKILGSRFFKKHNMLIPVKLNTSKFKREVEKALATTSLTVHGKGDSYNVQVGYSHFSEAELVENVCAVAKRLVDLFPGGFSNIKKLLVKSISSMAIPVYISLASANEVPVPVVQPHLPKAHVPVEGELSTVFGAHVKVLPSGEVAVTKVLTEEDKEMGYIQDPTDKRILEADDDYEVVGEEEEDEDSDDMDEEETEEVLKATSKKSKSRDEEESSEEEDDVVTAEDAYMQTLLDRPKQQQSDQKTNVKGKKKKKVNTAVSEKQTSSANGDVDLKKKPKKKKKKVLTSPIANVSKKSANPDSTKTEILKKTPGNKKAEKLKKSSTNAEVLKNTDIPVNKRIEMLRNVTPVSRKTETLKKSDPLGGKRKGTPKHRNTPGSKEVEVLKKDDTPKRKKGVMKEKAAASGLSSDRYFSPQNVMDLAEEGVPVTGKPMVGKKQSKKTKLTLIVPEKEVTVSSAKKATKRRESSSTNPKPKKMKGGTAVDVSVDSGHTPVNGEAHSAKSLGGKNKTKGKEPNSAKKRKSLVSDKASADDGSFTRYFSKHNQKEASH